MQAGVKITDRKKQSSIVWLFSFKCLFLANYIKFIQLWYYLGYIVPVDHRAHCMDNPFYFSYVVSV